MKPSTVHSFVHRSGAGKLVIGVRREDPKRIWERRTPLTPDAVHHLISNFGSEVHVVPCSRRVFPVHEYEKAGARIMANVDNAHIVLGIKEVPLQELDLPLNNMRKAFKEQYQTPARMAVSLAKTQTHLMFSHTMKGQSYNTPLLSRFVAHEDIKPHIKAFYPRLIDYELLTDSSGKRTVGFGWFAGVAGVLESLSAMAHAHLEIGIASPFLYTPRPHTLPSLERLRAELRNIGTIISSQGTPAKLGPFVIGLTGTGKVAEGCLSMLSELPIQSVPVADLDSLVRNPDTDLHQIYLVHAKPEDYFIGLDGRKYGRKHYYSSPQSYMSVFHDKVAPYLTLFLNGTGWSPSFPRLMTNKQLTGALERARLLGGARFTNIGDISCDVEGGLEFLTQATTLSSPFYKTRPSGLPTEYSSVQMMAVDILPASIPLDASKHFSNALIPYLESLVRYHTSSTSDQYTNGLDQATIASKGVLTKKHIWLQPAVNDFYSKANLPEEHALAMSQTRVEPDVSQQPNDGATPTNVPSLQPSQHKRILMLGSGMVAKPAVDMIAKHPGIDLVIASNSLLELQALSKRHLNVRYRIIDIFNESTYTHLVDKADVVVSLLPVQFHTAVAKLCIKHRKHMVTASYISQAMADLHRSAKAADVLLLNEIGLDPGIDHCSAVELINRLKSQRKRIVSFSSFCGGLPAPKDSYVPLRYKFSWRPQGVLTATMNAARYKLQDQYESVDGDNLLRAYFPNVPVTEDFQLEGIPNRNSLQYAAMYQLPPVQSLRTIIRGTLRHPGFSKLMLSFKKLGFLDQSTPIELEHWTDFIRYTLAVQYGTENGDIPELQNVIHLEDIPALMEALEWLGLVAPPTFVANPYRTKLPALPAEAMVPLDIFAYLLASKLAYAPHERDMVVLSHELIVREQEDFNDTPHGSTTPVEGSSTIIRSKGTETVYASSLITYGNSEYTAMSRTVGIPVAIAALNIAQGKIPIRGVAGPMDKTVYLPVLEGLAESGLGMTESVRTVRKGDDCYSIGGGGGVLGLGNTDAVGCPTMEQALVDSKIRVVDTTGAVEGCSETFEERNDLEREWKL